MTLYPADGYTVGQLVPMMVHRTDLWSRVLRRLGYARMIERLWEVVHVCPEGATIVPTLGPDDVVTIKMSRRNDGGLRIWSDDMPGLILSGPTPEGVCAKIWPAVDVLFHHKKYTPLTPARNSGAKNHGL